jgi:hypothetical protein
MLPEPRRDKVGPAPGRNFNPDRAGREQRDDALQTDDRTMLIALLVVLGVDLIVIAVFAALV